MDATLRIERRSDRPDKKNKEWGLHGECKAEDEGILHDVQEAASTQGGRGDSRLGIKGKAHVDLMVLGFTCADLSMVSQEVYIEAFGSRQFL